MDASCYEEVNEEDSVDIIEVLSLVLTSGLIDFDNYGMLHMSSGVREATITIADMLTMLVVNKRGRERIHGCASCFHERLSTTKDGRRILRTLTMKEEGEGEGQDEVEGTVETYAHVHRRMLACSDY